MNTKQSPSKAMINAMAAMTANELVEALDTWAKSPETAIEQIKAVRRWAVTPVHTVKTKASYDGQRAADVKTLTLTPKEVLIRDAIVTLEGEGPATYVAIATITGLGVSQVAGSTSVLLTKGFAEVHKETVDPDTGRVESVVKLTPAGREAEARPPKGGPALISNTKTTLSEGDIPAWAKKTTVPQIISEDWDLDTDVLDDLEEAVKDRSPKVKISTLWESLPSRTTDALRAFNPAN